MEKSLTPVQRVYRKFLAGRPPAPPKNTPLAAVSVASDQRERLARFLASEDGLDAHITSMNVVVRIPNAPPTAKADAIAIQEGQEGNAIKMLEAYGAVLNREFIIVGLQFAVLSGDEKWFFAYPIERTPEGEAAFNWSCERQRSGAPRKAIN